MGVVVDRFRTTVATSTGNQTFTGDLGGLTPKAAMFIVSLATADGTERAGLAHCIGMADGTTEAAINVTDQDNVATSNSHAAHTTSYSIVIRLDDQTTDGSATFVSFGANAVTVNWDDAPSSAWFVDVILFGGSDLSADVTATLLTNTVDTAHDITGPGFEPDLVISITAGAVSSQNSIGFVHNDRAAAITQHAIINRHRDARDTTEIYSKIDDSYGGVSDAGAYATDANCWLEFSTFDSSGFTITTRISAPGASKYVYTLSLNLGSASPVVDGKVWIFSTPTATGANTDTGPGFQPQFVFYLGSIMEAVDTYYDSNLAGSHAYITIDAAGANCSAFAAEDNVGTSNTESLVNDQAVDMNDDDGTALLAATFTEFTASGVTLNWSAVHTSAKKFIGLAIETAAAGPTTYSFTSAFASIFQETASAKPTFSAVLKETASKTAAFAALLNIVNSFTAGANAILQETASITAAYAAILKETVGETAGYSAILQETPSATAAYAALLKMVTSQTFAANAVLQETASVTAAYAAILQESASATAGYAAVLKESPAATAAFNAIIKMSAPFTSAYNAVLKETATVTAEFNAWLQDIGAVSVTRSFYAILKETASKTAAFAAQLNEVVTNTAAYNAIIKMVTTVTAPFAAVLKETASATAAFNSWLQDVGAVGATAAFTAILKETASVAPTFYAVLKETGSFTAAYGAVLTEIASNTAAHSAVLKETAIITAAHAGILQETPSAVAAYQAFILDRILITAAFLAILKETPADAAAFAAWINSAATVAIDFYAQPRAFAMSAPQRATTLSAQPRAFTLTAGERND